ncbi:hypothetical protein [Empedobacter brevis]|uniref:hypothetical protein n=1 Tax=Empedobacter brevis TaxID=247 RepID=UPI0028A7D3FA|nr:hypothetical protein [Empedobacter brevis]
MSKALDYEYLIRAGHNVSRFEITAANADIYRGLHTSYVYYRDNNDANLNDELLFKYAFDCGEIATNIKVAIYKFEKDLSTQLSEDDKNEINKICSSLNNANITLIDEAIERTYVIFEKYNRFV